MAVDPLLAEAQIFNVNSEVIGLTPAVSLATSMLALAGTFSREQLAASNQAQLNSMSAMLELARVYAVRDTRVSPVVEEALGLVKQVVATAQASA